MLKTEHWKLNTASGASIGLLDGNGDPREFAEVVRRKGLTVAQLVQAGIAEGVARRAVGLGPIEKGVPAPSV